MWLPRCPPSAKSFLRKRRCHAEPSQRSAGDPGPIAEMPCFLASNRIGAKGFEPSTSWSQTRRSNQAELRPVTRPFGPAEKVYPKSAGNQSAVGFQALPTPSPRVPHRERILSVDAVEVEKEGVDVELRRPVGIGGDLWRLPGLRLSSFRSTPLAQPVIWRRSR